MYDSYKIYVITNIIMVLLIIAVIAWRCVMTLLFCLRNEFGLGLAACCLYGLLAAGFSYCLLVTAVPLVILPKTFVLVLTNW